MPLSTQIRLFKSEKVFVSTVLLPFGGPYETLARNESRELQVQYDTEEEAVRGHFEAVGRMVSDHF